MYLRGLNTTSRNIAVILYVKTSYCAFVHTNIGLEPGQGKYEEIQDMSPDFEVKVRNGNKERKSL